MEREGAEVERVEAAMDSTEEKRMRENAAWTVLNSLPLQDGGRRGRGGQRDLRVRPRRRRARKTEGGGKGREEVGGTEREGEDMVMVKEEGMEWGERHQQTKSRRLSRFRRKKPGERKLPSKPFQKGETRGRGSEEDERRSRGSPR